MKNLLYILACGLLFTLIPTFASAQNSCATKAAYSYTQEVLAPYSQPSTWTLNESKRVSAMLMATGNFQLGYKACECTGNNWGPLQDALTAFTNGNDWDQVYASQLTELYRSSWVSGKNGNAIYSPRIRPVILQQAPQYDTKPTNGFVSKTHEHQPKVVSEKGTILEDTKSNCQPEVEKLISEISTLKDTLAGLDALHHLLNIATPGVATNPVVYQDTEGCEMILANLKGQAGRLRTAIAELRQPIEVADTANTAVSDSTKKDTSKMATGEEFNCKGVFSPIQYLLGFDTNQVVFAANLGMFFENSQSGSNQYLVGTATLGHKNAYGDLWSIGVGRNVAPFSWVRNKRGDATKYKGDYYFATIGHSPNFAKNFKVLGQIGVAKFTGLSFTSNNPKSPKSKPDTRVLGCLNWLWKVSDKTILLGESEVTFGQQDHKHGEATISLVKPLSCNSALTIGTGIAFNQTDFDLAWSGVVAGKLQVNYKGFGPYISMTLDPKSLISNASTPSYYASVGVNYFPQKSQKEVVIKL